MNSLILTSPDKQLKVKFSLQEGLPFYSIDYNGLPLLLPSSLALVLEDGSFRAPLTAVNQFSRSQDDTWEPLYGERSSYRDYFNEITVQLKNRSENNVSILFRAYNEGVAFRYSIDSTSTGEFTIQKEHSQFHFPTGTFAYEEHGAEGEYEKVLVKDMKKECERPLTVELPNGIYASIMEANQLDYSRTLFTTDKQNPWIIVSRLSGILNDYVGYDNMTPSDQLPTEQADAAVCGRAPFQTPWRVIIAGETPGQLLERNGLLLNLCDPCSFENTSWIKPGSGFRDMTLSTEGAKKSIDTAVRYGMKYVSLDWGWYGDPFDDQTDGSFVSDPVWFYDPKLSEGHPGLCLQEVIQYAEQRDIGIFLYIDRRIAENQLDTILPVYRDWGIKGVKIGFVNTGPQYWTRWLIDVLNKCAEHRMLVNIHDAYRPTGLSRTFPHLLTQEGIRGNEHMPNARHNTTLPFTRLVAGAGDYTICYYTDRKKTTFTHQLAMAIIAYSPYQSLFWYDTPEQIEDVTFFRNLPVTWDDKRVLSGKIGEWAVIARRNGSTWYVGAITNEEKRDISIELDFLEKGKMYRADLYTDDGSRSIGVNADTSWTIQMKASGGQAIQLTMEDIT